MLMYYCKNIMTIMKIAIIAVVIAMMFNQILDSLCVVLKYLEQKLEEKSKRNEAKNIKFVNNFSQKAISRWFYMKTVGYNNEEIINDFKIIFCSTNYNEVLESINHFDNFLLVGNDKDYSDEYLDILRYSLMILEICKRNKEINEGLTRYKPEYFNLKKD